MNLRELFDKLTPGMLDSEVQVSLTLNAHSKLDCVIETGLVAGVKFLDDGTVIIVAVDTL